MASLQVGAGRGHPASAALSVSLLLGAPAPVGRRVFLYCKLHYKNSPRTFLYCKLHYIYPGHPTIPHRRSGLDSRPSVAHHAARNSPAGTAFRPSNTSWT